MTTIRLARADDFNGFRAQARALIADRTLPENVQIDVGAQQGLFAGEGPAAQAAHRTTGKFSVPRRFVELGAAAACHRYPHRYALLYRVLFRMVCGGERRLLADASDEDIVQLDKLTKAVRRDCHKMKAFVRFREAGERYIAWFEPDHFIVRRTAPFFSRRFTAIEWAILTPDDSVAWTDRHLVFGPGVDKSQAPKDDALEDWWRTYYANIFNPARLKTKAMSAEMPAKYWKNLPESELIAPLIRQSGQRQLDMVQAQASIPAAKKGRVSVAPKQFVTRAEPKDAIGRLRHAIANCQACPLWQPATQAVVGDGRVDAIGIIIGEAPGDKEDLAGKPFIGPAGRLLNDSLKAAGLSRDKIFVTNAVKHFKFEPRGKQRLHKSPSTQEIEACRPWLEQELALIKPKFMLTLGASAARAVTGKTLKMADWRGQWLETEDLSLMLTYHPSYLLRLSGQAATEAQNSFNRDIAIWASKLTEQT